MITEDYVSFETAKLLKEKGFDLSEFYGEWAIDYDNIPRDEDTPEGEIIVAEWHYPLITLQMAMKWLRMEHKKFIDVYSYSDSFDEFIHGWSFLIRPLKYVENIGWNWDDSFKAVTDKNMSDDKIYNSYEEACEAAIKYCLENLI